MKLFVPGRICLFGEHSDWAGGYRRINKDIEKGYAILVGTNQGVYAEVRPHAGKLIFHTTLNDGTRKEPWEIFLELDVLYEEAKRGGFYSYVAGTAYQLLKNHKIGGLIIDNFQTDLPVKKGLSSSAAICVLVARSFNHVYGLKLDIRDEMEIAYQGEIMTGSQCGRLDQGCAYGNRPIEMIFDGDRLDVDELAVGSELFLVIVDLKAEKDTREILSCLNAGYPVAETVIQRNVQNYLGTINRQIVGNAITALERDDAEQLGQLMIEAQAAFDEHLQPACPAQLTAPVLHRLLEFPSIQPFIYGGKGVGSQDGTAQLIARDKKSQKDAIKIIEHELGMDCLELVIQST